MRSGCHRDSRLRECQGPCETINLRLGLELMCWDSNPAKTWLGTLTHNVLTRTTHLISGLTEAQILEFWLSHHRKNSAGDKMIAEK